MTATFPPWLYVVMSAVLGVSVTINVAFLLRQSQLANLRRELDQWRVADRHLVRNWIGAVALQLGQLRTAHNEHITRHHAEDIDRLTIPQPPPFDAADTK